MRHIALSLFLLAPLAASADDLQAGDLVIADAMAFATAQTAMAGAGYLTVTNTGDAADALIAVEAGYPRVMIHTTQVSDGVSTMMHLDRVELPPGETIMFAPGGLHVMFMGLDGNPFKAGDEIPAVLVFENAGRVPVMFDVVDRPTDGGHGDGKSN